NVEKFVGRIMRQWLQFGLTLQSELHLQLGADAKSDLPIRHGGGKVWSLWLRLANLQGSVPLQSPRRAVILAVLLGSDRHARLRMFLSRTDLIVQISHLQSGLVLDGHRVTIHMTCVGDLPALCALTGITQLGRAFPLYKQYFAGYFGRCLCGSCLGTPADV